jgi:hypothetical protein
MRGRPGVGPERRSDRGTALPETALVLASVLVMVFGILQVGIIGFMQVMVDGAAFIAAHEYSLYNSSYLQLAQRPFPQLGSVVVDKNTPDAVSVPVNYGTTSSTQRHGGVSLILPSHLQGTAISFSPHSMLSALSGIAVHGSVIEPMNQVSNDAYDAAGAGYGGSSALTTFSTDAMNTPYYYVSQHEMTVCTGGWNTVHVPGLQDPGCLAAYQVRSLGTAEFLDHDNWQRTTLGVGPYATSYTFAEMLCHQQMYAKSVAANPGFAPWQTVWYSASNPQTYIPTTNVNTSNLTTIVGQIYSWDTLSSTGAGSPSTEASYGLHPMNPANYC